MTPPFDFERFSQRLAPLGAILVVVGVLICRWVSIPLIGCGLILLLLSCWSQRDGFLLFGPFVTMELKFAARRTYVHLFRFLLVLASGIAFCIAAHTRNESPNPLVVQSAGSILILCAAYFVGIFVLPFGIQAVQASIAGERENQRLDFLLVTDLRNREIVLGRGFGRSVPFIMLILALTPFVVATPDFFGLPSTLTSIPLAYALMTFLSVGGITLYSSTTSRAARKGNPRLSLLSLPFVLLTMGIEFLRFVPEVWAAMFTIPGIGLVVVGDILEYISIANPVSVILRVISAFVGGMDPLEVAGEWLPIYAAYHLSFFFFFTLKSINILRTVSADLAGQAAISAASDGTRQLDKPVVSDRPVLWKEMHFHDLLPKTKAGNRTNRLAQALLGYIPSAVILVAGLIQWDPLTEIVVKVLKFCLPMISWMLTVAALRIAAGAIARERERNTLTSLIATPLENREILLHKWLGVYLTQRSGLIWMLLLGVPACITGLYPAWAFIGIFILTIANQCAATSAGLLASIYEGKSEKAIRRAFIRGLLVCGLQVAVALIPLFLTVAKIGEYSKYGILIAFPFSSLIAVGYVKECPPQDIPYWFAAGMIAAFHMLLIAWLVFRYSVKRYDRMSRDGTLDLGVHG
ncbi:MAG: ABC transporter permease subunit [Gemmataceae bacterium]